MVCCHHPAGLGDAGLGHSDSDADLGHSDAGLGTRVLVWTTHMLVWVTRMRGRVTQMRLRCWSGWGSGWLGNWPGRGPRRCWSGRLGCSDAGPGRLVWAMRWAWYALIMLVCMTRMLVWMLSRSAGAQRGTLPLPPSWMGRANCPCPCCWDSFCIGAKVLCSEGMQL